MNNFSKTNLALSILLCGATMFAQEQQPPVQPPPAQGQQNGPVGYGPGRYGAPAQGQPAPYQDGRYQNMPQQAAPVPAPVAMPTGDLTLPAGTLITVRVNQAL